jgi:hypothetical protein
VYEKEGSNYGSVKYERKKREREYDWSLIEEGEEKK